MAPAHPHAYAFTCLPLYEKSFFRYRAFEKTSLPQAADRVDFAWGVILTLFEFYSQLHRMLQVNRLVLRNEDRRNRLTNVHRDTDVLEQGNSES